MSSLRACHRLAYAWPSYGHGVSRYLGSESTASFLDSLHSIVLCTYRWRAYAVHRQSARSLCGLGACPRKKSLKNNALELRGGDLKISHFPETRVLTGD